jgi:hypothetical protein
MFFWIFIKEVLQTAFQYCVTHSQKMHYCSCIKGGSGDGFSVTCYTQSSNAFFDIYKGGAADGFAFTCLGSFGLEVPLPIDLLSFIGQCQDAKVLLKWTTASETDNAYFVVERSPNTVNWEFVDQLEGAGNSSSIKNYFLTDAQPFDGIMYYRLKQVDTDGNYEYFDLIAIESCRKSNTELTIYPNPATGVFNLSFAEEIESVKSVQVFNALGEKVYTFTGYQSQIDLSDKEDGVYFIKLQTSSKVITRKIVLAK